MAILELLLGQGFRDFLERVEAERGVGFQLACRVLEDGLDLAMEGVVDETKEAKEKVDDIQCFSKLIIKTLVLQVENLVPADSFDEVVILEEKRNGIL